MYRMVESSMMSCVLGNIIQYPCMSYFKIWISNMEHFAVHFGKQIHKKFKSILHNFLFSIGTENKIFIHLFIYDFEISNHDIK